MDPESVAVLQHSQGGQGRDFSIGLLDQNTQSTVWMLFCKKSDLLAGVFGYRHLCVFIKISMEKLDRFYRDLERFPTRSNALRERPMTKNLGVKKQNNDGP